MKRKMGFIGAAALALSLTACGDPELKAAQNYMLPGSKLTMQELLESTYGHGEWTSVEVPEDLQGYLGTKKIVMFFGVTHGLDDMYEKFQGSRDEICQAMNDQVQSVLSMITQKKAAHPEYASKYEKEELRFRREMFANTKFCKPMSFLMFLDDITLSKEKKNSFAFVGFEFDDAGNPILKEGRSAVEYAASCSDSPSACSMTELNRAEKVASRYEKFKESRLEGKSLSQFYINRLVGKFDSKRHAIEQIAMMDEKNGGQTPGVLKLLTEQTEKASAGAYDLMKNQKFSKDIDKVLKDVADLQTTGKTQFIGRRGKADGGFNEGYAECGSGDGLAGLLGGGGGGIATKAKGSIRTPSERDIDMGAGGGSRSKAEIMKVIKQRTPGLRHIYNKFLKKKPGFAGKVTLKFTIAPGGEIISISIASSTTGFSEFDNEIKSAVSRWKLGTVKSGNTTVTIPFTFSEE